jgi:hypothetical protein
VRVGVFGDPAFGGVQLRGVRVAEQMGWEFVPLDQLHQAGRFDVGIVVKYVGHHGQALRHICDDLIYDPLDAWHQADPNVYAHWWGLIDGLQPDVVIATSPACEAVMRLAIGTQAKSTRVVMIPHQPDTRLKWVRDPQGPIVYDGDPRYLGKGGLRGDQWSIVNAAAKRMNLRAKHATAADRGERMGVSLILSPRLEESATHINRYCKPQIKLANAAFCGIPVLATDDAAVMTLAKNVTVIQELAWLHLAVINRPMWEAINSDPVDAELGIDNYGVKLLELMETL